MRMFLLIVRLCQPGILVRNGSPDDLAPIQYKLNPAIGKRSNLADGSTHNVIQPLIALITAEVGAYRHQPKIVLPLEVRQ
jgi:hypothetical protein